MPEVLYAKELQELKKFNKDLRWFQDNYQELKKSYKGEYVAVSQSEVMDHDKDLSKILKRLKEKGFDTRSMVIEFVNPEHKVFVL